MYNLFLTAEDITTLEWVNGRYSWSDRLLSMCVEGDNEFFESEAWSLIESFKEDTEGGHSYFPCLDHSSELATKLFAFIEQIV